MTDRSYEENMRSLFVKYQESVEKLKLSNGEAFDKAILTLSSSGLALSLSILKFVVPFEDATCTGILFFSWYSFLAAIISTIVSFRIAQLGYDIAIEYAEKYFIEDKDEFGERRNIPASIAEFLNWFSAIAFISAIVCTIAFVTKNIG